MAQIEVEVTHTTKKIVEVEFPIYTGTDDLFDWGGGYETWTRIDADGKYWELTLHYGREDKLEWEFESGQLAKPDVSRHAKKSLESSFYRRTEEQFMKALGAMRSDLARFPEQIPSRDFGTID